MPWTFMVRPELLREMPKGVITGLKLYEDIRRAKNTRLWRISAQAATGSWYRPLQ